MVREVTASNGPAAEIKSKVLTAYYTESH